MKSLFGELEKDNKYARQAIRWEDKGSHYELIFTDDFVTPSSAKLSQDSGFIALNAGNSLLTDIIVDMRDGDKHKEVHVFVGSFGGEVAALNMILQQLLTYDYRVGINLGTACSCGWMLLFACQERYVSPFSQAMYHEMSCICGGKHSELQRNAEFMARWQKELLKVTDTAQVLTPDELALGRTTEVWFTGQELIARGAARDYSEYLARRIPMPGMSLMMGPDGFYAPGPGGWKRFELKECETISYPELLKRLNSPQERVHAGDHSRKKKRSTSQKSAGKAVKEQTVNTEESEKLDQ